MAGRNEPERVTLHAPTGTQVTVSADAADRYMQRGYKKADKTGQGERKSASPARSRSKRQ